MDTAQRNPRTFLEHFEGDHFRRVVVPAQLLAQASHRRRVEHRAHRKVGTEGGVDRRDRPHRGQRIAAEVEERVVDPDPLDPEDLSVDAGDQLFGLGLRRLEGGDGKYRFRQRLCVDLARGGQRELLEHDDLRRHHVFRQPRAQPLTHRADLRVGLRIVGMGTASVSLDGRQVDVGQSRGAPRVGQRDEHRVEGAGLRRPR